MKEGLVTMPIVKTTYLPLSKGQLEATRKHAGTARIGAGNQLLGWVAGVPFPEPKNALELAWNTYPTISRADSHDELQFHMWFGLFQGTNYEKHFVWDLWNKKYRARVDMPPLGDMPEFAESGLICKESMMILEPNEVRGFLQIRNRFWDVDKADECYSYIPAIRRVRRMTGSDLTDPILGSDDIPDDFEGWRQKLNAKMTFRVLEHRDFLAPRCHIGMEERPAYDYKKSGPVFPIDWEIRPQWVLEIMTNDPDYVYSKRVLYIDAVPWNHQGRGNIFWTENFDQKGRLREADGYPQAGNRQGYCNLFNCVHIGCQIDHYTVGDCIASYVKDFDKTFPLSEEVFTIKCLLKRAR